MPRLIYGYPEILLKVKLMSKARPRVTRNGTYMPKNYQDWRKEVARQMKEQWALPPIDTPIAVDIECAGAARGDIDNYMGAIFDTGNKILWMDDRSTIIKSAYITFRKASEKDSFIKIQISDLEEREAEIDCIERVLQSGFEDDLPF